MANDTKTIAKNTIYLYVRMFIVMAISLYTSRVVLNTLGVVDYGIFNVVYGFVSLFGFLNATLSASMQRFYNFNIGKKDIDGICTVYSTGLVIHCIVALIVFLLLETLGLWYVNTVMVLPAERLIAANILFQVTIISMSLMIIQIPYLGLIMAYEKMDYYGPLDILRG